MYEIGEREDNPDAWHSKHSKMIMHCVTDFKTYSNRVIKMKLNL